MDHPKSEHSAQLIKVIPTYQPNRVLFHKPTDFRFKVVHQAVKQSGLFIIILVLQSERLMYILIDVFILFQTTPCGVFAVPQQIAILIGHFSWDADLVAVEVVGLLASFTFSVDPVVYLCQRFVAAGISVDIGISAVQSGFLQYMAVAPNEASMVFEVN